MSGLHRVFDLSHQSAIFGGEAGSHAVAAPIYVPRRGKQPAKPKRPRFPFTEAEENISCDPEVVRRMKQDRDALKHAISYSEQPASGFFMAEGHAEQETAEATSSDTSIPICFGSGISGHITRVFLPNSNGTMWDNLSEHRLWSVPHVVDVDEGENGEVNNNSQALTNIVAKVVAGQTTTDLLVPLTNSDGVTQSCVWFSNVDQNYAKLLSTMLPWGLPSLTTPQALREVQLSNIAHRLNPFEICDNATDLKHLTAQQHTDRTRGWLINEANIQHRKIYPNDLKFEPNRPASDAFLLSAVVASNGGDSDMDTSGTNTTIPNSLYAALQLIMSQYSASACRPHTKEVRKSSWLRRKLQRKPSQHDACADPRLIPGYRSLRASHGSTPDLTENRDCRGTVSVTRPFSNLSVARP